MNTDFSDCPEMTDEQLAQLRLSHYRKMASYTPNGHKLHKNLEKQGEK